MGQREPAGEARRRSVRFIRLPNKEYWLAKERKQAGIDRISGFLDWFGVALMVFFMALGHLVFLANSRNPVVLNESAVWTLMACLLVFVIAWTLVFYRKFNHA